MIVAIDFVTLHLHLEVHPKYMHSMIMNHIHHYHQSEGIQRACYCVDYAITRFHILIRLQQT
jgi:hypothetical protein